MSHHPPVSAYQLVGSQGGWKLSGWSQPAVAPVVKFYGIKTLAKGRRRFELPDGTVIEFFMPHYAIKGALQSFELSAAAARGSPAALPICTTRF